MKIIVYPHELAIGGSQINAIDLAAGIRDLGHEVIVYGLPGPLETYIASKSLRYVPAYRLKYRPAPNRIVQLAALVRKNKIDVVHAYEWPPCLDAFLGAGLLFGTPILCTVLSMSLQTTWPVPRVLPLIVGTEELAKEAQAVREGPVIVMEPPIDTDGDNPHNDGTLFRKRHGIVPNELLVVTVSRLSIDLKRDALVDAIEAADLLANSWPVRLVIVGDGECASYLGVRSAAINHRHKREVITMAGASLDPRPAYAAADVVVGMGSSALRALAHGKPVVVQGERGFSAPFDEAHKSIFFQQGFYGIGDGTAGGPVLARYIAALLHDPERRKAVGVYGRKLVVDRYSLRGAASRLCNFYEAAMATSGVRSAMLRETVRSAWLAGEIEVRNHLPSNKRARAQRDRELLCLPAHDHPGQSVRVLDDGARC